MEKQSTETAGTAVKREPKTAQTAPAVVTNPGWSMLDTSLPAAAQAQCPGCASARQVQAKLFLSHTDDPLERQADQVADLVSRPSTSTDRLTATPTAQNVGPGLQSKSKGSAGCTACATAHQPTSLTAALAERGGSAVPKDVRAPVESVLQTDLSEVRVHHSNTAGEAAADIGARAFTHGSNVYLGAGERSSDKRLMGHELTHVVQQRGGSSGIQRWSFAGEELALVWKVLTADDVSEWTEERRLQAVRTILQKVWVAAPEEYALEKIWRSFGEDFLRVAEENIALWRQCYERGLDISNLELPAINSQLQAFEAVAVPRVLLRLSVSEQEILREKARYGITSYQRSRGQAGGSETVYNAEDTPDLAGLAVAAGQLLEAREEISNLRAQRTSLMSTRFSRSSGDVTITIRDQGRYDQLGTEITAAEGRLRTLRDVHEQAFPVLAAFAELGRSNNNRLRRISRGYGATGLAETIGSELDERLEHITQMQHRLASSAEYVYKLPVIIQLVLSEMTLPPEGVAASLILARASEIEGNEALIDGILAALAISFAVLAAIPSGGSSLLAGAAMIGTIGGIGTSVVTAARSLDRYMFESVASGSTLDKVQAISAADPSFLWVAIDIVSVGIELHAARAVFNEAVPVIRRALSAAPVAFAVEVAERVNRLMRGAGASADEAAAAAAAIRRQVLEAADPNTALGRLHAQLDAVDEAIAARRAGLREVGVIEDGLHELKAAENGRLIRCSEYCLLVSIFYADELAASNTLSQRLEAIESAARNAPDGGPWQAQARQLLEELRHSRVDAVLQQLPEAMRGSMARIVSRELPIELEQHILEVVSRLAGRSDLDAERLARMLNVLAHTDEVAVYEQMANTIVRLNLNHPGGRHLFHGLESAHWGELRNFEEVTMLEAQLRGYGPSRGSVRGIDTGTAGEALQEARTAAGAEATVLIGDPAARARFEQILLARGEVRALAVALESPELLAISNRLTNMVAERLHLSGAGFGIELVVGISYGEQVINQLLQNRGVEMFIRALHSTRPAGVRYVVAMDLTTMTRRIGDETFEFFESVTYQVRAVTQGTDGTLAEVRSMFETTIDAGARELPRSGLSGIGLDVEPSFGAVAGHLGIGAPRTASGALSPLDELALLPAENLPLESLRQIDYVDFRNVDLSFEDLTGASLRHSNLTDQNLLGTSLRGADLTGADLSGAMLSPSMMSRQTILPDGSSFEPILDLTRFTDPAHPDFWRPVLAY